MESNQNQSRIEMIDLELGETSVQARELRTLARNKKRANDHDGYQKTTQELTRVLSRREILKSERLSLLANLSSSSS